MNSTYDGYEFYKKMLEMQEKLRKSEEERIRLEERFNLLEQESRIRHEACINKLRMRYIEFLEEQKLRDERNNRLLNTLDNVDTNLALMSAKTDRLQALRKEYEASVFRVQLKARSQAVSITGDSGIVSHKYDKKSIKDIESKHHQQWPLEPLYHHSRIPRLRNDEEQDPVLKLNTNEKQQLDKLNPPSIKWSSVEPINWSREQIKNHHYPENISPFRYPEKITASPKNSKLTRILVSSSKEECAGNILENELERYINNIRSLHGQVDSESYEEEEENDHEENTSGDLLNVTLSDDGFSDHLPIENNKKDKKQRHSSKEIEKILALADDLVSSKTVNNQCLSFGDEKSQLFQGQSDIEEKIILPNDENQATLESKFLLISTSNESNQNIAQEVKPKINQSAINTEICANQESQDFTENKEKTEVAQVQIESEKILCQNENIEVENPIEELLHLNKVTLNELENTENEENAKELLHSNIDAEPEIYNHTDLKVKEEDIENSTVDEYYQQDDGTQQVYHNYDENAQYEYQEQYSPYDQQEEQQYCTTEAAYSNNYTQDTNQEQQQQQYPIEHYPQDSNQQQEYNNDNYEYTDYNNEVAPLESENNFPNNETIEIQDSTKIDESSVSSAINSNNDSIKNTRNVIKSILESDTDISTIENNVSNTESDFDFN